VQLYDHTLYAILCSCCTCMQFYALDFMPTEHASVIIYHTLWRRGIARRAIDETQGREEKKAQAVKPFTNIQ